MSQRTGHDLDLEPSGGGHRRHSRPAEPRRRRSFLALLVALLLLAALVGGVVVAGRTALSGLGIGGASSADYPGPGSGQVVVKVAEGATAGDVGRSLQDQGVVKSASAFTKAATANSRSRTLQPGFYRLKRQMKAADALTLLLDPSSRLRGKVTVPEGFTAAQVVDRLAKQLGVDRSAVQQAVKNTGALGLPAYAKGRVEGFLFPATYDFEPGTTPQQALQTMVDRFSKAADDVSLEERAKQRNITPYEAVVIASLIERESRVPSEYPKVSRVIYNRLDKNIRLGIDATILYGLGRTGGALKESELKRDGPYNTRTRTGLPPTPIASPGQAALEAALAPATGDWLYYVLADKQGNHLFTADYDAFVRQKAKSLREGIF